MSISTDLNDVLFVDVSQLSNINHLTHQNISYHFDISVNNDQDEIVHVILVIR